MKNNIEVELRGLLTKKQYNAIKKRLKNEGVIFEVDDKDTYFFNVSSGVFKICDETSKDQGKISLKLGKEETGAMEELEICFKRDQVPLFLKFFKALGYTEYHLVPQKRTNFFLRDATLSLKYTPDFQYHFELEGKLLSSKLYIEAEKLRLQALCAHYGLIPMEPNEISKRVKEIRKRIGFDK